MRHRQRQNKGIRRSTAVGVRGGLTFLLMAGALVGSGCGQKREDKASGCVIVDISDSSRKEIQGQYLAGMDRFVTRIAENGSGNVCFGFAARGLLGGPASWAQFGCDNPADELRCRPQIRTEVNAAAAQLAGAANGGPKQYHGASELLEALGIMSRETRSGDEILVLSDSIQNSRDFGNFYSRRLRLNSGGRERLLDKLDRVQLLPDLSGRSLRIPYALTHSGTAKPISAVRQQEIRAFWHDYAARTHAQLSFGQGRRGA